MRKVFIQMIKIYQKIPGRFHQSCRHIPTCSNYGIEAIEVYGSAKGIYLTTKRVLKCTPWGSSGLDPVPKKESKHEKIN